MKLPEKKKIKIQAKSYSSLPTTKVTTPVKTKGPKIDLKPEIEKKVVVTKAKKKVPEPMISSVRDETSREHEWSLEQSDNQITQRFSKILKHESIPNKNEVQVV